MIEKLIGEGGSARPRIEKVDDQLHGIQVAKDLLNLECDSQTALFLSGGSQRLLYEEIVREGNLELGAAAMVDERYTFDFHDRNETMIRESGFVSYIEGKGKIFHPIYPDIPPGRRGSLPMSLKRPNLVQIRGQYDGVVGRLLSVYKGVAILGLGADGHTASLPAGAQGVLEEAKLNSSRYVEGYDDFPIKPRERITLTPKALSEMRLLVLIAFGGEKRKALEMMLRPGPISKVPARFLTTKNIAQKTILITDQKL